MSLGTNPQPERIAGLPPKVAGYGFAIVSTLLILLLRWRLWGFLGDTSPFVLFLLSVVMTARLFGPGPGLLAAVLGAVTGFFFFTAPRYSFILGEPKDMVRLALFLVVSAGTVWMSLLRERSDQALRRSTEKLEYLLEIARGLQLTDQPGQYVEALYRRLAVILGLDFYLFHTAGEDGALRLESQSGLPDSALLEAMALPPDPVELRDAAARVRHQVFVTNGTSHGSFAAFMASLGATALAVYPLMAHERLVGSLAFGARSRRPFSPDELALMQSVCDQFATALDRAQLIGALSDRAQQLAAADRHKNEFLAMLAHELRNPLAAIQMAASVMRQRETDGDALERSRSVLDRQVSHMVRLLDDLLDLSRISQGKVRLCKRQVELGAILEGAVEACRPFIAQRRHDLRVALPDKPVWLDADETRLHQVVTNLLTNAAKYTEAGGRIDLSVCRAGDEVIIRVADTGMGIAPEMLPKVFDLFSQATRALNRAEGGMGIGLSLVRSLVEMHGGTAAAQSDGIGRGSQFTVRLPAIEGPIGAAATGLGASVRGKTEGFVLAH